MTIMASLVNINVHIKLQHKQTSVLWLSTQWFGLGFLRVFCCYKIVIAPSWGCVDFQGLSDKTITYIKHLKLQLIGCRENIQSITAISNNMTYIFSLQE